MAIATSTTIQNVTGFDSTVAGKVDDHLHEAEIECKRILSTSRTRGEVSTGTEVTGGNTFRTVLDVESERYDEIEALGSGDKHYTALQRAEALMATHFALPFLNLRPTEEGGLARAIGLVEGQNDLMSNMEMESYRNGFYRQAHDILMKLIRYADVGEKVVYVI